MATCGYYPAWFQWNSSLPTPLPSKTPTPTGAPTPTATPSFWSSVTINATWQNTNAKPHSSYIRGPFNVTIRDKNMTAVLEESNVYLDENGSITRYLNLGDANEYCVELENMPFSQKTDLICYPAYFTADMGGSNDVDVTLYAGNVDRDSFITTVDVQKIGDCMAYGGSYCTGYEDANSDGLVDLSDLVIAAQNMGKYDHSCPYTW